MTYVCVEFFFGSLVIPRAMFGYTVPCYCEGGMLQGEAVVLVHFVRCGDDDYLQPVAGWEWLTQSKRAETTCNHVCAPQSAHRSLIHENDVVPPIAADVGCARGWPGETRNPLNYLLMTEERIFLIIRTGF